jgi:prepilin-type processing-associated H-X9-DG protein
MNGHARARPGFTMVETLVVFCIVAGLIALLLPALGGARETARRTQCINCMKQLNTSMHIYNSTYGHFPPGVVDRAGPIRSEPRGYHFGWVVQLLPFLEQGGLSMAVDESASVYAPSNRALCTSQLNTLVCPSDPGPMRGTDGSVGTNYAGCHHDVEAPIDADNHGVLFLNSRIRYEDIEDGTSETFLLGETLRNRQDLGWASGTRASLRNTGSPINSGDLRYGTTAVTPWSDGTPIIPSGKLPDPKNLLLVGGFGSKHPGGANFSFCDGSVRFVSETIDRQNFQRLGHRADEEPIDLLNK